MPGEVNCGVRKGERGTILMLAWGICRYWVLSGACKLSLASLWKHSQVIDNSILLSKWSLWKAPRLSGLCPDWFWDKSRASSWGYKSWRIVLGMHHKCYWMAWIKGCYRTPLVFWSLSTGLSLPSLLGWRSKPWDCLWFRQYVMGQLSQEQSLECVPDNTNGLKVGIPPQQIL